MLLLSQDPNSRQARRVSRGKALTAGGTPVWWESKDSDIQIWRKVRFGLYTILILPILFGA